MKKVVAIFIMLMLVLCLLPSCAKDDDRFKANYVIDAKIDCLRSTISGTEKVTYVHALDEPTETVSFNLYANAYREDALHPAVAQKDEAAAYYDGNSYGKIDILSVTSSGRQLPYSIDETLMEIKMPDLLFLGEKIEFEIAFFVTLPFANTRLGVTKNGINVSGWYPVLCAKVGDNISKEYCASVGDSYLSDCASYNVTLTFDDTYKIASTGRAEKVYSKAPCATVNIVCENVRDFAFVLSDKLQFVEATVNGIEVKYCYISDATPDVTLEYAKNALVCFNSMFGAYPYSIYTVVETDFIAGGMEFPQLAFVAAGAQDGERERIVVHETAHQWWYGVVGSDNINEAWQDEGLAEYSTMLYMREKYGSDKYEKDITLTYTSYAMFSDIVTRVNGSYSAVMSKGLNEFMSEYEYVNIVYSKGLLLFDTLERLSASKTEKALKRYYSQNAYKIAGYSDLTEAFDAVGFRAGGIFDSWTTGQVVMLTV